VKTAVCPDTDVIEWGVRIALLGCLAACAFTARARPAGDAEIDVATIDASMIDAPDAAIDARMLDARMIDARRMIDAPPPFCDSADPTLVACYEFENTTTDASSHQLNATNTNVTFMAGKQGMAAHVDGTSRMNVAENAAENPPAITVEAWIKAPLPGAGLRAGIIDNDGVWGFFLQEQGGLQCLGGATVAANVPANTWTHVACTYDAAGTRTMYVNGVAISTVAAAPALGTSGVSGMTIAANSPDDTSSLNGDIDQLRILSVARTAQQIAVDAQ